MASVAGLQAVMDAPPITIIARDRKPSVAHPITRKVEARGIIILTIFTFPTSMAILAAIRGSIDAVRDRKNRKVPTLVIEPPSDTIRRGRRKRTPLWEHSLRMVTAHIGYIRRNTEDRFLIMPTSSPSSSGDLSLILGIVL